MVLLWGRWIGMRRLTSRVAGRAPRAEAPLSLVTRRSLAAALGLLCAPPLPAQRIATAAVRSPRITTDRVAAPRELHLTAPPECRRSAVRTVGQFLAGVGGSWVVGLAAFKMFDDPGGPDRRVKGDEGYTPNANTAYAIGSLVGAVAGVYLSGPRPTQCGSLLRTTIGAAVPSIPLFFGRDEPYTPLFGVVLAAPAQSLFATAMYPAR